MVHAAVTEDAALFTLQQLHSTRRRIPNLLAGTVHLVPLAGCSMTRPVNCLQPLKCFLPLGSALLWPGCHAAIQLSSCIPVHFSMFTWLGLQSPDVRLLLQAHSAGRLCAVVPVTLWVEGRAPQCQDGGRYRHPVCLCANCV